MSDPYGWIRYQALRAPGRTALHDTVTGRKFTYSELDSRVRGLAEHFRRSGLGPGDRVAILSHNSTNVFEILYACAVAHLVAVPLNWRLSELELRTLVDDCKPAALLFDDTFAVRGRGLIEHGNIRVTLSWGTEDDTYEAAVRELQGFEPDAAAVEPPRPDVPFVIIYTSGTTGTPKGVVHTIGSVAANVENSAFAGDVSSSSVSLTVLPTFHVAGLHLFANAALMHGGTAIVMSTFEPEQTLAALTDHEFGVTHFCGVPAHFQIMSTLPSFEDARVDGLVTAVGGSPVPSSLLAQWSGKGANMMSVYGITEAGSTVLAMSDGNRTASATAVGIPTVHTTCSVRGPEGTPVDRGEVGELWVRGPMLALEYWGRPDATAETIVDGWLRTGDAAMVDQDGFVHIVDRWKDMFISGGENVYPAEIENALYQHPDVVLASVLGTTHERWGEAGVAFVVLSEQSGATKTDLEQWCRGRLASYKIPHRFEFVGDLPRNATGKILKNELRKAFL